MAIPAHLTATTPTASGATVAVYDTAPVCAALAAAGNFSPTIHEIVAILIHGGWATPETVWTSEP